MTYTGQKLSAIKWAATYAEDADASYSLLGRDVDVELRRERKAWADKTKRHLFEAVTPITTLIVMENDGGDVRPVMWCPDADWAREYLESANRPETLSLWQVSREEPAPKDITLDFCATWADELDTSVDEDDFGASIPAFVDAHYSEGAWELYGKANGRE
jgi:hypothetical protein